MTTTKQPNLFQPTKLQAGIANAYARAAAERISIWDTDNPLVFKARSSQGGLQYTVTVVNGGHLACSCQSYRYCKHQAACVKHLARVRKQTPLEALNAYHAARKAEELDARAGRTTEAACWREYFTPLETQRMDDAMLTPCSQTRIDFDTPALDDEDGYC